MSLLRVDNLHAGYGPIEVLKGISLEVGEREIVTIIGANGAGKTSTLMCISGIVRARAGRIAFEGRDLQHVTEDARTHLMPHQIVHLGICQSPEGRKIFPRLTVLENLEMGAYSHPDAATIRKGIDHAYELFPILKERRNQAGGTLSGGEQQMLAVARALMGQPKLLLLDEPSLGLAPLIVARIFDVIRRLNTEGMAVLLVEQNARMALKLAHRGYVMETGKIVMSDKAETLLADQRVKDAYLGK